MIPLHHPKGPLHRCRCSDAYDSGKQLLPRKSRGQVAFEQPVISADRRTIGWLAMYPDPTTTYYEGAQLPFQLVIYRAGRVLHTFTTEQVFWDWQFQDGGRRVAIRPGLHTGEHRNAYFARSGQAVRSVIGP